MTFFEKENTFMSFAKLKVRTMKMLPDVLTVRNEDRGPAAVQTEGNISPVYTNVLCE